MLLIDFRSWSHQVHHKTCTMEDWSMMEVLNVSKLASNLFSIIHAGTMKGRVLSYLDRTIAVNSRTRNNIN